MRMRLARGVRVALFLCLLTGAWAQDKPLRLERDLVYGEAGGQQLKLDLARPDSEDVLPAVVFVHGGGWAAGDKNSYWGQAQALAKLGYVCATVGYRLVKPDTNKWPAQLDDVQRAVRWLRSQAARFKLDPERFGAVGGSAGGHLVALLGTRDTRDNSDEALAKFPSRVQCVVDVFGPTDFTVDLAQGGGQGPRAAALVRGLLGKSREEAPELYKDASPALFVDAKAAPALVFHGAADTLVPPDQSRRYEAALKKAGVEATLIVFEGEGHGFAKRESQDRYAKETVAFLNRQLKGAK